MSTPTTCDHSESLWGRCVRCGKTWEEQAADRGQVAAQPMPASRVYGPGGTAIPRTPARKRHSGGEGS